MSSAFDPDPTHTGWTFLTNHAHVLLCIARSPSLRLREVAGQVGITERAVQRIVADLEREGYLTRLRDGRRNHYEVHQDRPLRHPIEAHREIHDLLALVHGSETLAECSANRREPSSDPARIERSELSDFNA